MRSPTIPLLSALLAAPAAAQERAALYHLPGPVGDEERLLVGGQLEVYGGREVRAFDAVLDEGDLAVVVLPGQHGLFETLFPRGRLLEPGRPFGPEGRRSGYLAPGERTRHLRGLARAHDRARLVDLSALPGAARTHGGRSIPALHIAAPAAPPESMALVVGQLHAREWNTTAAVLALAGHLLEHHEEPAVQRLLARRSVLLVPCANPDGAAHAWRHDHLWRKNRAPNADGSIGVDLNRNFGPATTAGSPVPRTPVFRGPDPDSEPEVRTLLAVLDRMQPEIVVDLHSHGRTVGLPFAADDPPGPRERRAVATVRDLAGYRPVLVPGAGLLVGRARRHGALALLVETGTGFHPPEAVRRAEERRLIPALVSVLGMDR